MQSYIDLRSARDAKDNTLLVGNKSKSKQMYVIFLNFSNV